MFERVSYEVSAAAFTIAAFLVASSIFVTISIRAIRMKPKLVQHFENLPFETDTPIASNGNTRPTDPTA